MSPPTRRPSSQGVADAAANQSTVVGHNQSRQRSYESKRENWPGEGDSRTTERSYGPTIDQEEALANLGFGQGCS